LPDTEHLQKSGVAAERRYSLLVLLGGPLAYDAT